MDSKTGQQQQFNKIWTFTRQALKEQRRKYGREIASAVCQHSLSTGTKKINRIYRYKFITQILEYLSIDDDLYYDLHHKALHDMVIDYLENIGTLELISSIMRTEVGVFGSFVEYGTKKVSYEITDFFENLNKYIFTPGKQIIIKGIVGTGKTDLGCKIGEANIEKGGVFAANIPMHKTKGEIYDNVFYVDHLSDLLKLRLQIPMHKHIMMAIDEPESVFQNLLKITKEGKNIGVFFHLIRKYNISIISIWHFEDQIPDYLKTQVDEAGGVFIDKQEKKTAFFDIHDRGGMLVRIPPTNLNFISEGHGSAATFFIDLDIKKLLRKTSGNHPPKIAKQKLEEALNSKEVYLKEYQDKFDNEEEKNPLKDIVETILDNPNEYLTHTGRTFDWRKIKRVFEIGENKAKDAKNEALRHFEKQK